MDFNTQRKIVRRLEEAGKNPLLFLPCLIAKYAVILFMSACRAVDMALSDKEGNFLGIKRKPVTKKAAQAVPVPETDLFTAKKPAHKSSLPFRPLWQRAMSLLLACAFISMSAEISAAADDVTLQKYVAAAKQLITASEINPLRAAIYEADLYTKYNNNPTYALQIENGAFNGMPNLTTITLGYSDGMSIGSNNFVNVAPNAAVYIRTDSKADFATAANQITSSDVSKIWDYEGMTYSEIPEDILALTAYSGVGKVILKWNNLTPEPDGYAIYTYSNGKYNVNPTIISTDKATEGDSTRNICSVEMTGTSGKPQIYAVRAIKYVTKDYDGDGSSDVNDTLYSKQFTRSGSAAPLTAGTPTLTYTMSNKKVNLKVKMPTNYSSPDCYRLFSREGSEFVLLTKFYPTDFDANGEYYYTDPNLYSGTTRSYVVIAYYDVFGTSDDSFFESDSDAAELTTKRSSRIDVNEARLNPPRNLTVTPIKGSSSQDCYDGWNLVWEAPSDSEEIITSISYKVYANGIEVANPPVPYVTIPVDIQQGQNITFKVTAVCNDGSISESEAVSSATINVEKESAQLVKINGGNEKASFVFKHNGNSNTVYSIWGEEASSSANARAITASGQFFKSFQLSDCTANKDGTYTYVLSPLTNDVKYNFWLTSNATNINYPSKILSVTPSEAPQPPANIVGEGYENSAVITWDPVQKDDGSGGYADGYYVSVYKKGVSAPVINHVLNADYSYTAEKLENDVEYYAEVSAYVIVNGSEIEGPVNRSNDFIPTIKVDDVLNLTVTPSDKVINISWTAVKGATEYILTRTDPDGSRREIYKGNKTSFTDTYIDNKTDYSYKVMAVRTVDGKDYVSKYSAEQRGMINYSLTSVQGLTAAGGDGCIILKWDKLNGADGYYVQYSSKDADSWTTIANVGQPTFTHTGLRNGDVYDYRIIPYVTINNKEESVDTYAQKVTGKAGINLPAPADFNVTAGDGQITLKWSAVKGAEGYCVYLVAFDGSAYLLDKVSKTTAIHTNLSNNTTFSYKVCAYKYVDDALVEGDFSVIKTATVGIELNAPTDVTAKAGNEQVSLTWKKSDGAEGYVVYAYNMAQFSFTPVGIVTGTSFVHTGLTAGREYTYMIAAYKNVNGTVVYSGYSLSVTATPTSSGGTKPSDNSSAEAGEYRIYITGTTPYGMSNSNIISAFASKGAFNTDIDVRFTLSPDTVTAVQDVLNFYGEGIESFLIYPMDIAIYNAGTNTKATINDGYYMTLTIPVPDELLPYSEHISVVHVSNLDQLEILPSIHVNVSGVDCMQFTANSFSPYAFVVYLPEIGEDTSAGTPAAARGTSQTSANGQSAALTFRNTYLPEIYRRRARNKVYRIVNR